MTPPGKDAIRDALNRLDNCVEGEHCRGSMCSQGAERRWCTRCRAREKLIPALRAALSAPVHPVGDQRLREALRDALVAIDQLMDNESNVASYFDAQGWQWLCAVYDEGHVALHAAGGTQEGER